MNNQEVENCTIFLTIAGSKAYGTNTPESDTDVRGICIPEDRAYYIGMGMKRFEQKEGGWDDDRVIYDLRKAMNLMADGNPNMMDFLYTPPEMWLQKTRHWEKILQHREKFLSKKMRYTYGGYAFAQLKRIQRHRGYLLHPPKKRPERSDYGLEEKRLLHADDMGAFQWLLARFLNDSVQLMNLSDECKKELDEKLNFIGLVQSATSGDLADADWQKIQKVTGVSDALMELMMKEKAYSNAMNDWTSYQSWDRTRNDKRRVLEQKYGYDTKHAMHLVRLMRMGMEILETGQVHVFRPDFVELLEIRFGSWSYEKVVEYAESCEKKMDDLMKVTSLPNNPDRNFLDKLCQEVIMEYVF